MSPVLALVIANIVWGGGLPFFKHTLHTIPPFLLAFLRFSLASFILVPFVWKAPLKQITQNDWRAILWGAFFATFINISALFLGLERASSITAGVFAASQPIFFFLLSIVLLKERAEKKVLSGILISLVGICIIIFMPILSHTAEGGSSSVLGIVFYFLATMGAVVGPIILKPILGKVNPIVVTYFGFIISAVLFLPMALHEVYTGQVGAIDPLSWAGLAYGIFGSSTISYLLFNYGTSKVPAQELGIFSYINPITSAIIASFLFHEYPDKYFFIGALVVFVGIIICEGRFHHPKKKYS